MTRVEQALRWWRNQQNECLIPTRHRVVLETAGIIITDDPAGAYLTTYGRKALAELDAALGEKDSG